LGLPNVDFLLIPNFLDAEERRFVEPLMLEVVAMDLEVFGV
jgi:hypothetical protein